jgi:hypothetical protein
MELAEIYKFTKKPHPIGENYKINTCLFTGKRRAHLEAPGDKG